MAEPTANSAYSKAIDLYAKFLLKDGAYQLTSTRTSYALAYSCFLSNNYTYSAKWFRKFVKSATDTAKLTDANLRNGDAYFMQGLQKSTGLLLQ